MKTIYLLWTTVLLLLMGCGEAGKVAKPDEGDDEPFMTLTIEPVGEEKAYNIVIRNLTEMPISYHGYGGEGSSQPVYEIEVQEGDGWSEGFTGWCGLGMGPCEIEPGSSISIPFYGMEHNENAIFRISISALKAGRSEWNRINSRKIHSPIYQWKNQMIEQRLVRTLRVPQADVE
jgi:hypothetical protein